MASYESRYKNHSWGLLVVLFSILGFFVACSGDDDDDNDQTGPEGATKSDAGLPDAGSTDTGSTVTTNLNTGTFLDSRVAGLEYSTPSTQGTTDAKGTFEYATGETVTFSLGSLVLGSATGKPIMTPLDLVDGATDASDQRVNNRLVFLQTLDQNGDLNDGIQIGSEIVAIVAKYGDKLNFDQDTTAFAADANALALVEDLNAANVLTDTDPRPRILRSAKAAREHFERATSERKEVMTQYGAVNGYAVNDSAWQWLGIPYGKPPLGDLRWKPTEEPDPWTEPRDAVAWSDQAAQDQRLEKYGEGGMSEDCLYLNITAPAGASNLPVMVWFHGGGFVVLTSNTKPFNNASSLPTKGVVLVSVNHRLGLFGYMAHPLLSQESGYGGSGNYGQLDLIQALKWVKTNIANFGGDPNSVTIFGESGGGRKVLSLLASPMAAGLFHRAISQSGTLRPDTRSLEEAEASGTALSDALKVTTLEQLRAVPWPELVDAGSAVVPYTNVDKYYLPDTERAIFETGKNNDVPFMIVANENDQPEPRVTFRDVFPWMSEHAAQNFYACLFTHVPTGWKEKGLLAYHGLELAYVFNAPQSVVSHYRLNLVTVPETGETLAVDDLDGDGVSGSAGDEDDIITSAGFDATDTQVTDTVMTFWTNFAKTGDPTTESFKWPVYTKANDAYVDLGATPEAKTGQSTIFQD